MDCRITATPASELYILVNQDRLVWLSCVFGEGWDDDANLLQM